MENLTQQEQQQYPPGPFYYGMMITIIMVACSVKGVVSSTHTKCLSYIFYMKLFHQEQQKVVSSTVSEAACMRGGGLYNSQFDCFCAHFVVLLLSSLFCLHCACKRKKNLPIIFKLLLPPSSLPCRPVLS